jgi:hypothetical protein
MAKDGNFGKENIDNPMRFCLEMIEDAGLEEGCKPLLWVIIEIQFRPCIFVWVFNFLVASESNRSQFTA